MRTLLCSLALVMAVLAGVGALVSIHLLGGWSVVDTGPLLWTAFWELFAVPFAFAWLALELVRWRRPCVMLDPRREGSWSRVAWGGWIAAAWLVLEMLGLWLLRRWMPELLVSGVAGVGAVLLCSVAWEKCREGFCVNCGYDLHKTSGPAPCPECGREQTRYLAGVAPSPVRSHASLAR